MKILKEEFLIQGRHETHKIALADQGSIRRVIHDEFGPNECRLEVAETLDWNAGVLPRPCLAGQSVRVQPHH